MEGKRVSIVTGCSSTSGIGKVTAMGLAEQGHHVIMACRRMDACERARLDILQHHPQASCECMQLDLEDFTSIRSFAAALPSTQIEILVNNAGVMGVTTSTAPSASSSSSSLDPLDESTRLDRHFRINHLGTYLLTRLMLPLMKENGRIVTVGSEAHRRANLAFVEQKDHQLMLQPSRLSNWYVEYANSKLGNSLMTAELSKRLQQRGSTISTSCVSPGRVNTNIFRHFTGVLSVAAGVVSSLFFQTPQQGASGVLRAATDPVFEGRHVPYIHHAKEAVPSSTAQNTELAAALWEFSNVQVGLSPAEEEALWPKC